MNGIIAIIVALTICCPNHPLNRDVELRAEVAGYFQEAAELYDIPVEVMVYWGYRESSLRVDRVGALGEKGICQAHGRSARACRQAGLDLETYRGGIYCMGYLMAQGKALCGSLERGLNYYASGTCKGTKRSNRIVKQRMRWIKKNKK